MEVVSSSKLAWFVLAFTVVAAAAAGRVSAQNTAQDFVNLHNSPRTDVGVGSVTWNTTVAAYAQSYANQRAGDCRRPLRGEPLLGLGGLRLGGVGRRGVLGGGEAVLSTTTPPTPAPRRPASRAATTRRWCGAPPRPSAAPASSAATTPASSSSAITTHQATSLDRAYIYTL